MLHDATGPGDIQHVSASTAALAMDMEGDLERGSSLKRKPSASVASLGWTDPKRIKLDAREAGFGSKLPAEIWHRIFLFLPPKTLGILLTVNKLFHKCLDPCSRFEVNVHSDASRCLPPPRKPDAIWQASRRLFWPHMPGPLKGRSEVDMWRLCCSRSCQFCSSHELPETAGAQDQWHRGPGAKGVAPVFPFFVVSCGNCLSDNVIKEVNLLLSPWTPSFLLAGLPLVFVTSDWHVIPPQLLSGGTGPVHTRVNKVFSAQQVKDITAEFETVKSLGYAAAEEWIKGLEARGKRLLADASRWERWHLSGGVHDMRTYLQAPREPSQRLGSAPSTGIPDGQEPVDISQKFDETELQALQPVGGNKGSTWRKVAMTDAVSAYHFRSLGQQRRTGEQAAELEAMRKAEIERRAALLKPPMTPRVLELCPAFHAAVHKTTAPFDDIAWKSLKPRLSDQRRAAERREKKSVATGVADQGSIDASETKASAVRSSKDVTDKDWDDAQGPLRARISAFADEMIRKDWNDGRKVSKKAASQFAIDVLLHVRKRFYAEVAKDAAAARAAGDRPIIDPPEGPWTQKLTLENMKWIFDTKIKQHTDRYSEALFLCNGCHGHRKAFGLQSVIQHYAAKHTTDLSVGNVVVCWRAEWPKIPVFNPGPKHTRASAQQTGGDGPTTCSTALQPVGYNGYNTLPPVNKPIYEPPLQPPNALQTAEGAGVAEPNAYPAPNLPRQYLQLPAFPPHPQWPRRASPHPTGQGHGASATSTGKAYHWGKPPTKKENPGQYMYRIDFMAKVAKQIWTKIAHIKDLPEPAMACILVHHVVARFETKYSERAPLNMFIDVLSNHRDMRRMRGIKYLRCKVCELARGSQARTKFFTLPQLVNHFKMRHIEARDRPQDDPLDWHLNMIWPPEKETIPKLPTDLGKDKVSIDRVVGAFPSAFETDTSENSVTNWQRCSGGGNTPHSRSVKDKAECLSDSSSAESYQPQYNLGGSPVKVEGSTEDNILAATNENARPSHKAGTLDAADRPVLQPASVVYGRVDASRQSVQEQDAPYGGHPAQPGIGPPAFESEGVERHPTTAAAPPARLEEDGLQLLEGLESHLEAEGRVFAPTESSRRGMRCDAPPGAYSASWNGHVMEREYPTDRYHGSAAPQTLPRPDRHQQDWHQERSARLAHAPSSARQVGGEYMAYRGYADELLPRRTQAAEPYELIEVRDPQGGYLIKRPIRQDSAGFYSYATEPYPRRAPAYEREMHQPTAYEDYRRPATHAPQRPPSRVEYEEYDPRYPATGRGNMAPRDARYQGHRE